MKNRSLEKIEERMKSVEDPIRYKVLDSVKRFKTSWVELGQALYSVWKDKLYKSWGYGTFDLYTSKEIGIRKQTAMKLLKSYYFLEKEEPRYLEKEYTDETSASQMPNYDAVDVLRRAKNKKTLDNEDYRELRAKVFEKGKDAKEIKKDLTQLIKEREELEPEEAMEKRRQAMIKRLLSTLKALKRDAEVLKLLPSGLIKEIDMLAKKIEREIG
ncbi:MAG: hypothetical protein JW800_03210 [Candidatus Omnitrophica bacterium]|nr:hypothetical protein [Candidatus Omnitrophota bacterium]